MKTVDRTFDILEAILYAKGEIGLTELSLSTGLNKATVYRISSLLMKRGYVSRGSKRGKYFPGLKFAQYRNLANISLGMREQVLPYLQKLSNETCETVNCTMLDGLDLISIAVVASPNILQVAPGAINKYPLHCTSMGKIFLAEMPNERIDEIIRIVGLKVYTDNTIIDGSRLKAEIEIVKQDGVAFDREEYLSGVKSVAAPIKGQDRNIVAAISLAGPSSRISDSKLLQLGLPVKNCAFEISRSIGFCNS
jgi:DNA-binding IclR family transcriptional regulator